MNAIVWYSTSLEDLETTFCFLDRHEIREWPKKTQNPMKDFWVSGHEAQSESQYPLRCIGEVDDKRMP